MAAVALLLPLHAAAQPVDLSPPHPAQQPAPKPLFRATPGAIGMDIAPDTLAVVKVVTFRGNPFWRRTPTALPTALDLASDRVPVAGFKLKF